ncbi:MAG: phosphate signaling complex protein PhoU [Pirellulaceae bacterium]|nr:phosphate signaling complex protein PhoU [Planctomycetales bacterium]
MSKHLQRDLEHIERELLALSAQVEEMIALACNALTEQRLDIAVQVIDGDQRVDEHEVLIEEECLKILALHQPVAVDLRRTTAVLKINNDLERIGDLAVNIAERAEQMRTYPTFPIPDKLLEMAEEARSMLADSLDSFVRLDVHAARGVCRRDDAVDLLNAEVISELREHMHRDGNQIEPALYLFSASRHIERIADLATNIAEDVIYLVEGEIARHRHDRMVNVAKN